jgi:hypothetical protein
VSMLVAIVSGWKFWRSANRKTGNPGLYLFSNQTPNWLQDPYLPNAIKFYPSDIPSFRDPIIIIIRYPTFTAGRQV